MAYKTRPTLQASFPEGQTAIEDFLGQWPSWDFSMNLISTLSLYAAVGIQLFCGVPLHSTSSPQ
jgi:hypothetical protein